MTDKELTEWEHQPHILNVLTSREMGAWLERRDSRILQEIRQEIFENYRVQLKTDKPDDWWVKWNECIDECLEIIYKHIKEIEESDKE